MKICTVIGARPQFIKHAAFESALSEFEEIQHIVVHTGQHYDDNMSQIFFKEFELQQPDYMLQIGSHSHGKQTALMLIEIEKILQDTKPDFLVVYGDTNSTLAGALAAKKMGIKLVHIEAGLRSFNNEMPEEINRILTDRISDFLFVPSEDAMKHLEHEALNDQSFFTGDIMKDLVFISQAKNLIRDLDEDSFYYTTIHRPYNTDDQNRLRSILEELNSLDKKVIFSHHPRTKNLMSSWSIDVSEFQNIAFIEPVGYFENLSYIHSADALLTDSGGMQKEAYWLRTKCISIRSETEWTETLHDHCNTLVFNDLSEIKNELKKAPGPFNEDLYGNGKAAKIMIELLYESYSK